MTKRWVLKMIFQMLYPIVFNSFIRKKINGNFQEKNFKQNVTKNEIFVL